MDIINNERKKNTMKYREIFPGVKVSALGYGCMRFPTNPDETINEPEAISLIRHAIDSGVNYIDTAFGYHHGKSEGLLKMALADGYREKVFLADKMPVWLAKEEADFEKLFNIQLERLGTDHIDFYLLHSLNAGSFRDTVLRFDLFEKMRALKRAGKVSYIGFSFHDSNEVFHEIVDSFEGADFCQIQYNWANTDYQAGTEGLEYAHKKGLGVIIMEPLLGGGLVNLPDNVRAALPEGADPVGISLDYLWSRPEVGVVLSGMSNRAQLDDNLRHADDSRIGKLTEDEIAALARAKKIRDGNLLVPCTGCEYCLPCPAGIEIPVVFRLYNKTAPGLVGDDESKLDALKEEYRGFAVKADECLKCGRCEGACPQHISVRDMMDAVAAKLS